jgi:hypothetical protein
VLKVLKVLKVLNFSGAGEANNFTCTFTFTGGGAEGPDPVASGNAFIPVAMPSALRVA